MVCVGGCVLRGVSGVWHWSEMPGSVSQPWFLFDFFHLIFIFWFEEWYLHPPSSLLSRLFLFLYSFLLHPSFLHHCSRTVRSNVGKRSDECCTSVLHLIVRLFEELHIWMDCSLAVSLLHVMCVFFLCVFMWTGSSFCIPFIFLSFLCCSLSLLFLLFSVWCVFDWEGCRPYLIGLLLHLMLADWLVLLTSGDVMRSWLAVCNLCMNSSIDVFCIVFNWWICRLIHLLFPSFFLR